MKKKFILKQDNYDTYDCDWTGSSQQLVSPLNRVLTNTFLDEHLRSELCHALNKAFPSIHLVLDCKDIDDNVVYIGFEYTDNLVNTSEFFDAEMSYTIGQTINLYFKEKGVDVDSGNAIHIISKLMELCPKLKEYFDVI